MYLYIMQFIVISLFATLSRNVINADEEDSCLTYLLVIWFLKSSYTAKAYLQLITYLNSMLLVSIYFSYDPLSFDKAYHWSNMLVTQSNSILLQVSICHIILVDVPNDEIFLHSQEYRRTKLQVRRLFLPYYMLPCTLSWSIASMLMVYRNNRIVENIRLLCDR